MVREGGDLAVQTQPCKTLAGGERREETLRLSDQADGRI